MASHRAPTNHGRHRPGALVRPVTAVLARLYLSTLASLALCALLPLVLGWHSTVVMSGSMEPSIATGDVLAAQPVSESDVRSGRIRAGMVVLAVDPMWPDTLYTHRVAKVLPDGGLVTKGDANAANDPIHLGPADVKGIEMLRVPYLGIPLQAVRTGNPAPAIGLLALTVLAVMIVRDGRPVARPRRSAEDPPTRARARRAKRSNRGFFAKTATGTAIMFAALLAMSGSEAAFSGWTGTSGNNFVAAASFGARPQVLSCGGATYTASANTAITCTPGTVSGTTTNYTVTVNGTGALVQWTITADWSGVAKFSYAKAYGTGVTDTGNIAQQTGYQIHGATNGSTNPADSWNHAWVSSTKATETFTVQVTTT